ncbi:hypothetical protein KP509_1Z048600 [Ceratopteris richardii]|nr:hypothetical protein KP509_1Z048600 [Ceratopteris richardii]
MIEKTWRQTSTLSTAQSSVLDIQFSNSTSALYLLVISADGYARIYMLEDSLNLMKWQLQAEFQNSRSPMEINGKHRFWGASIAWRKSTLMNLQPAFVVGCNSTSHALNSAKVWEFQQAHQRWFCIAELCEADESDKPVNHVSWAQNIGRSHELIAVASGDGVSIWQLKFVTAAENNCSAVRIARLTGFEGEVWQVEWDMSGMTLASSGTDGVVRLWQTNLQGEWKQISQI